MKLIAETGIITLLLFALVFHVLVVLRVIPFTIVWGGRLKTLREMYRFEAGSITINLLLILLLLCCAGYIDCPFSAGTVRIIYWCIAGLFFLNTIGNLFSKSKMEQLIFTPVTLLIAVCAVAAAVL
jgi:hypothetical protein